LASVVERKGETDEGLQGAPARGNLVDVAVGIVIGVAFAALVAALVSDLTTPLIAAIGGNRDFSGLSFTIHKSPSTSRRGSARSA
jgi:large conductance mechanosensitive channel protein